MKYMFFYHKSDLDGLCSGAIAKYYADLRNWDYSLYPIEHYDNLPFDKMNRNTTAFFLDIFPQPYEERFQQIVDAGIPQNQIVVCDHHKTFIDTGIPELVSGECQTFYSGCELTWNWLFPDKDMPQAVHLLGRYDVWDKSNPKKRIEQIVPFQYGARMELVDPIFGKHENWVRLFEEESEKEITRIIKLGKDILAYEEAENIKTVQQYAFDAEFRGLKVIACCSSKFSSNVFASKWDPEIYDAMMCFCITNDLQVKASLYVDDKEGVDVSIVAKEMGGGGHKGAAGFIVPMEDFFSQLNRI